MALDQHDNAPSDSVYSGVPLDPTQKQIRVLTFLPGDGDEPPACTFSVLSLSDKSAHFNALSYAWGDPTDTTPINVNGVAIAVTKSLANALCNIRNCRAPRISAPPIWADALCIYQRDDAERI